MSNYIHKVVRGMRQKTRDSFLDPKEKAKYFKEYRGSLGIDSAGLPTDSYQNLLVNGSIRNFIDLANIKTDQGTPLAKPLKKIEKEQIDQINSCLQPTPATEAAIARYAALFRDINSSTQQFETEAIASYLQELKGEAIKSISQQHESEKINLTNLFTNDAKFQEELAKHNLPLSAVKDQMLKALEDSHVKAIKKFEEALDKPIKNLHVETQNEHARIAFLAALYKDKEMKKIIDAEINRINQNKPANATILANSEVPNELFKGVKVENLVQINSMSGRNTIIYDKESKTFGLQLPLLDIDNQVQKDLESLALTIKASGHSNITMKMNHPNKEKAEKLGRKAYAACIAAGFNPNNIHILVNGKELTNTKDKKGNPIQGELYAQHPKAQQKTSELASRLAEAHKQAFSGKYKEDLQELKAKSAAPAASQGSTNNAVIAAPH